MFNISKNNYELLLVIIITFFIFSIIYFLRKETFYNDSSNSQIPCDQVKQKNNDDTCDSEFTCPDHCKMSFKDDTKQTCKCVERNN